MRQFLNKHVRLITALFLLLVMAGIAWFGVVPFYGHIRETRNEIQKFYASREHRNSQFARLPDIRAQFEAVKQDEGSLDILLTQARIVDFVKTLEMLAQMTNVDISIKAEDKIPTDPKKAIAKTEDGKTAPQKKNFLESLPSNKYLFLRLTLAGDYASLLSFLHKMETSPFALDVVAIDIHPKNTDDPLENTPSSGERKNPFSLSPSQGTLTPAETQNEATPEPVVSSSPKPLEAFIDVAVYVDDLEPVK